jgi:hypothetical protein
MLGWSQLQLEMCAFYLLLLVIQNSGQNWIDSLLGQIKYNIRGWSQVMGL